MGVVLVVDRRRVLLLSNIARFVKEKLEIARKQFDESYGSSDRIIANDVKEEAVYPMAAERIISESNLFILIRLS